MSHYERADRNFDRREIYQRGLIRVEEHKSQIARRARLVRSFIEIDPPRRDIVAWAACELASFTLGIDPPAVREMTAEEIRKSPNKLGYALPSSNTIAIRMNGSDCACKVACVTAHETKHRQQMIEGRFMGMLGKGESEPAAEKFQKEFTEKFLAGVRCECRTRPVSFSHLLNR